MPQPHAIGWPIKLQLVRLTENKRLKVLLADLYERKTLLAG
jgi:hypothetical protein